jgi:hypothetical protein
MRAASLGLLLLTLCAARASAFSKEVHEAVSRQALSDMGFDASAAGAVVAGNLQTDKDEFTDPKAHFDDERFAAGSARLNAKLSAALDALDSCDAGAAREQLGRALHAVQDFFAHSNWVENHAPSDPIDMLNLKDPPPGLVCDPKTHKGGLTSGYYPDDKRPSPDKCVHAELNKDDASRPYHELARLRALAETKAMLALFDRAIAARFAAAGPDESAYRTRLLKDGSAAFAVRRVFCRAKPAPLHAPGLSQSLDAPAWR